MAEPELDTTPDTDDDTGTAAPSEATTEAAEKPADEFTPPTREEWTRTQAALKKANEQAKQHRMKVQELSKANEDADSKAAREATEQAQAKFKPIAVKAAAKAEFLAAGLNDPKGERVAKLSRLLDLDQVDVDDDGEVSGLSEQIASIKTDYPELFERKPAKPGRVDTAGRKPADDRPKSTGEKHAELLFARNG